MRALGIRIGAVASAIALAATALGQTVAFTNGRVIPIDGDEIESGYVIVVDGKIAGVGAGALPSTPFPDGEGEIIDCRGKVIMPGLVDTHSHLAGFGAADGSGPIQPGVDVGDSVNVRASSLKRALAGGLTTLNIMPGSGHLSSGRTVYVKLRFFEERGPSALEDIRITDESGWAMGGLKMANGTNPIREDAAAGFPGTRGRSAYLVRKWFYEAMEYGEKIEAAGDDATKLPPRNLHYETLLEVMSGKRIVHHHTHRADDIMTVLRMADEFGFRVVLHHISEGWIVAEEIAAYEGVDGLDGEPWGAPCSMIIIDAPGGKLEAVNVAFKTGKALEDAGAKVAFHTDDWITDSRLFFRSAALAVRAGMTREGALYGLTQAGADMMDLGDRVGSLTVGKDGDVIVLSGDPLSVYTRVEQTWVEGQKVFDRSDADDRLYAEGGYGAGADIEPYFCCYDHLLRKGGQQ